MSTEVGKRSRFVWGATHKVRSLGMWLKLETGMLLMLLLFSVLSGNKREKRKQEKMLLTEEE